MRSTSTAILRAAGLMLCVATSCSKPAAPPPTEVVVVASDQVPADPADARWTSAPEFAAKLILQDLVEPRKLTATTSEVRVRALSDGTRTAFRLEWKDETLNDLPGAARFSDACAVQIPQRSEASLPAPQMGELGQPVEIAYWSAAQQALVDGRGQSIKDLYPNASIDHYPFEAKPLEENTADRQAMAARYAPALAIDNPVTRLPVTPVQDLIAEGPGTLAPAPASTSCGKGARTGDGWAVVIVRSTPITSVALGRTNIAFAVWDGAHEEVGARKMRTGWLPAVFPGKVQ